MSDDDRSRRSDAKPSPPKKGAVAGFAGSPRSAGSSPSSAAVSSGAPSTGRRRPARFVTARRHDRRRRREGAGDGRRAAAPPGQRRRAGQRARHAGPRRLQLGREEGRRPRRDRSHPSTARRSRRRRRRSPRSARNLESAKAQRSRPRAGRVRAHAASSSQQNLASQGRRSTRRRGSYDVAQAQVDRGERADRRASRRSSQQSQTNVGYTKIYSPVDGVVVTRAHRSGRDGRRELPGAGPLRHRAGPPQDARPRRRRRGRRRQAQGEDGGRGVVDAFPGESFHGIVSAGSLQPEQRRRASSRTRPSSRSRTPTRSSAPA